MLARLSLPLALVFLAAPAAAERPTAPVGGEAPTLGVRLPVPSLTGDSGGASLLEVNPGALGTLRSWSLHYHHAGLREESRVAGTGDGFFFATPLFGRLTFGAGLQWLRPATSIGYADSVKLGFGFAVSPSPKLSIGLGYHGFIADSDPALDGLSTLDLGMVLRPTRWIAAGFAVKNLTTPLYNELPLQRVYDFELTLRPILSRRLELGLGLRIGERRGDLDPHGRLVLEPLRGLRLMGDVEIVRRDFYRTGELATDVRATVALGLNLEQIGMLFSTTLGRKMSAAGPLSSTDSRSVFQGVGLSVELSGERKPPLFETRRKLIELKLAGKLSQARMLHLVSLVSRVERRRDIVGVLLHVEGLGVGWAQAQELRALIKRLRRAGKQVYAYLEAPGARAYYIASAAQQLLLDPDGGLGLTGLAGQALYLRGMLDLLGVEPQFVKIAEYKSAPEMFTRKGSTPAAKRQRHAIFDGLFAQLTGDITRDRGKRRGWLTRLLDEGPFTAQRALAVGLVDKLVEPHAVRKHVIRATRAALVAPSAVPRVPDRWPVGPGIAVINIEGDIVSGKSRNLPLFGRQIAGDQTVVQALEWARKSNRVRGIVLRVNSPGGSALASAHMWRAVKRARKVKPVIVSFADLAASGGYYAGCAGDRIYAMPATITGSIGIFTGKFNVAGLLDKIGVTVESVAKGKRALINAFNRSYTKEERAVILKRLRHFYKRFVQAVADGRKMKWGAADKVARGRVWTGRQARARKLVDAEGGLIDALREAKRRAGLPLDRPVPTFVLPRTKGSLLKRALRLAGHAKAEQPALPRAVRRVLGSIPPSLLEARSGEPLTRLPYRLELSR